MPNAQTHDASWLLSENIEKALSSYLITLPAIDRSEQISSRYSGFCARAIFENSCDHRAFGRDLNRQAGTVKHAWLPEICILLEVEPVVKIVEGDIKLFQDSCADVAGIFRFSADSPGILEKFGNHRVDLNTAKRASSATTMSCNGAGSGCKFIRSPAASALPEPPCRSIRLSMAASRSTSAILG